jgi:hypothetical protein
VLEKTLRMNVSPAALADYKPVWTIVADGTSLNFVLPRAEFHSLSNSQRSDNLVLAAGDSSRRTIRLCPRSFA